MGLKLINEAKASEDRPLTIEEVDGEEIRNTKDTDFIAGGHHWAYEWIEKMKVLIEKNLEDELEKIATIIHEFCERILMSVGKMSYEQAHNEANKYEKAFRDWYVTNHPTSKAPDSLQGKEIVRSDNKQNTQPTVDEPKPEV